MPASALPTRKIAAGSGTAAGVLLYELLTGRRPYELTSRTPAEIARVICDSVPERPSTAVTRHPVGPAPAASTDSPSAARHEPRPAPEVQRLRRRLAGDLDNIVLKALSKEPARRYASVDQFSEDVRRHLAGLPVLARRDTIGYRAGKFVRRHRAAVAAAAIVLLALVGGIIATAAQARIARRERTRAEQRFDDMRQLAKVALLDIHDAIRDLPGSTPARRLLVGHGLEYLDKLTRDSGDLRRELAAAYVKIGDVQGRPLNPNLGDAAGALASYRKAVATYDSIGAGTSGDPALRRELALACQRLSEVLSTTGDTKEALAQARRGLELLQRPVDPESTAQGPVAAELGRELAASYSRVGDLLSATGDTDGALEHRRRSLSVMEAVASIAPDDVSTIRQLGSAHSKLGNQLGNPNYQRALEIHQELAANDPANDSMTLEVASDYNRLATAQAKAGARQGLENHTRAVDMVRELQEKNPANVELQVALGLALASRGDAHALWARSQSRRSTRLADLHAAERDYAESVAIFTALQRAGSIEGTDRQTLENNRKALEEVRADRSR